MSFFLPGNADDCRVDSPSCQSCNFTMFSLLAEKAEVLRLEQEALARLEVIFDICL